MVTGKSLGNFKLAAFLAYKSIIKGNRWTLIMIILVTSLSFANLIIIPSLMSGVTDAINKQQIETLFGNIIIDPPQGQYFLHDVSLIESKLKSISSLEGVAPHINSSALFEYDTKSDVSSSQGTGHRGNWNVIGIEPEKEVQVTTICNSLIDGSYLSLYEPHQIVLGVEIAGGSQADNKDFLTLGGVRAGDQVRVTFSGGEPQIFTVKGIFKARQEQANRTAYISAEDMKTVLGLDNSVDNASQILIRTVQGGNDDQIIQEIMTLGIQGQIRNWLEYGGGVGGLVSSFRVITDLIGAIGLVVAGVVMFIVIYIHVNHRRRQIGILRAIGVNRGVVILSYLFQALLFAALGIIFGGLIIGYVITPYFDGHPIDLPIGLVSLLIDPGTVKLGILGLIAAAILAGIIPVLNITRESIIQAIWGN
jgi:putative ABC transport system permease protein